YGGSSRHVLDPNAAAPHLRVYGPDGERAHTDTVYDGPGSYDMTWDVDFTDLARLAEVRGVPVAWYGHQRVLETPPIDLWSRDAQPILIKARAAEGQSNPMQALIEAHALVSRFREAAGFRMILLGSPGLLAPEQFGPSDPVDGEGLWTLGMHV